MNVNAELAGDAIEGGKYLRPWRTRKTVLREAVEAIVGITLVFIFISGLYLIAAAIN